MDVKTQYNNIKSYTLEVKNNKNNGSINPVRTQFIAWRQDNSLNRITDGVLSALSNNLLDWIFLFRLVYVQDIPYFLNYDVFPYQVLYQEEIHFKRIIQKQLCSIMYEVLQIEYGRKLCIYNQSFNCLSIVFKLSYTSISSPTKQHFESGQNVILKRSASNHFTATNCEIYTVAKNNVHLLFFLIIRVVWVGDRILLQNN